MPSNQTLEHIHKGKLTPDQNFEQQVWAVTARIPQGKVATYAWVAKQLKSTGYRAVGRALGRNPYAPAVPCHRVIGSNGSLTGFAHGLAAKERLLRKEGVEVVGGKVDLARFGVK